ncbi:olfactory receptor 14A16-like [Elgaria multicarinata webbii]|uniref:olfactory receptor 14A16-like n=1 Tax=Elgaria multicarinata webbii TaxID=159646 RepID=UPI002FCD2885
MSNQTRVTEFLLHGFSEIQELQTFYSCVFLIIYLVALMENLLIIISIIYNLHLHKPMYFFLANLASQDLGSLSVSIPKSMTNSFLDIRTISYSGCVSQVFFLIFFMGSHYFLLGVMAYDRYVAICNPLHYETVMTQKTCIQMAASAWITGFIYSIIYTGNAFTPDFCSNEINHFFCEIPQLIRISCSESYVIKIWVVSAGCCLAFVYFVLIIYSYVQIFKAVLRIPSAHGKQKAFSTCLPHLMVVSLFMISGTFAYLGPASSTPSTLNLWVSVFYCIAPPLMNPLIYSMRNRELKMAFWKLTVKLFSHLTFPHVGNWMHFRK